MVHVWSCYHFTSQDVVTTTHEPLATYSSDDKLFVATSQCYVEVYDLQSKDCPQVYKFPTVDLVKEIVFSETDDYVATLEGSSKSEGAVRIYFNWTADLTKYPMRARVAGDLTSMRQCQRDTDENRMEVVGIPLKNVATCIGIDGSTGNLAIGVGRGVLVYAVCCKVVQREDGTNCGFEDMKCLLELTFDFKIKQVALCEEYIAAGSDIQFQVVRLNLKSIPPPTKDGGVTSSVTTPDNCPYLKQSSGSSEGVTVTETQEGQTAKEGESKLITGSGDSLKEPKKAASGSSKGDSGLESSSSHSEDGGSSETTVVKRPNRRMFSRQSSNSHTASSVDYDNLTSSSSTEDAPVPPQASSTISSEQSSLRSYTATVIEESNPIVEDEFHVVLNVNDSDGNGEGVNETAENVEKDKRNLAGLGATSLEQRTVLLNNIQKAREKHAEQNARKRKNFGTEILGPKLKHPVCPVRVEYESVCCSCPNKQSSDLVRRGVITCVYKKINAFNINFHSLQLKPFYSKGGPCTRNNDSWEEFISVRRGDLVGMFCFASTLREGFLYDVMEKVSLVTLYPYAAECIQVRLGVHFLYAATANSIEIYTTRCWPTILRKNLPPKQILPSESLEICLIGLQPFIGLTSVNMSFSRVVLLSKMLADRNSAEEDAWCLYALYKPYMLDMLVDMMELGEQHQAASLPTYLHLLQECHMMARSHLYMIGDKDGHDYKCRNKDMCYTEKLGKLEEMVTQTAYKLGHYYAGVTDDSAKMASPYYLMSGKTLHDLIAYWQGQGHVKQSTKHLDGFVHHLDQVLFDDDAKALELSEAEENWILELYVRDKPQSLSTVLLKSQLAKYSNELALESLTSWMNGRSTDRQHSRSKHLDILAMAVLHLELGNLAEAEAALFSLAKKDLVEVCVQNHSVLHEKLSSFSPLSQLLRRHKPEVFIQILVDLHDNGVVTMDTAIGLLQGAAPKECDLEHSNGEGQIVQYLELLLNDAERHYIFQEAAALLVPRYVSRLRRKPSARNVSGGQVLTVKEIVPKGQGHFGKRYAWLDHMPPFQGPKSLRQACLYLAQTDAIPARLKLSAVSQPLGILRGASPKLEEAELECSCAMCCAELLKLQSLLVSHHADEKLLRQVLEATEVPADSQAQPIRGHVSIRVLCLAKLDPKSSCDLVLEKHPEILASFMTESFDQNQEMWSHVTTTLLETVKDLEGKTESDTDKCSTYKSTLKELLSILAERMSPSEFVNMLPFEGRTSFFLEFIERSVKAQQAKELLVTMQEQAVPES